MTVAVDQLLAAVPDTPRWVETRGMLLRGGVEVAGESAEACAVLSREARLMCLVGRPPREIVEAAAEAMTGEATILADRMYGRELAPAMSLWRYTEAGVYTLPFDNRLPKEGDEEVRLLDVKALAEAELPADFGQELATAARYGPVAATMQGGVPVSFAYAVWTTEKYWDVSVDTLEAYRGMGYAMHCVAHLIRQFRAEGRNPVWGAVESNYASIRVAEKLGFQAVDQLGLLLRM